VPSMRLARPLYEALPLLYAVIGAFAIAVSYVDAPGPRAAAASAVGLAAEIAALTLYLRRRGYREMRREYSGADIVAPPALAQPRQSHLQLELGATRDAHG